MLYKEENRRSRLWRWLRGLGTRRGQITDIRELSPYLRADIGARDGEPTFRD